MQYELSFKDIENLGILKRFQELLFNLTGLIFDFVNIEAKPSVCLKAASKFSPFCQLIYSSPRGFEACKKCDIHFVKDCVLKREPIIYKCHLGLAEILVPLIIRGNVIGCLASGQFLTLESRGRQFQKIRKTLSNYSIDLAESMKCFNQLPVIKKEKAEAIVDLISLIGEYIMEMEHKIIELRGYIDDDRIQKALEYGKMHFREEIHLEDIASIVSLSPSRFAHLFKEKTNTTFVTFLNELRIDNAKNLLCNTSLQVLQVALESGFRNISSFNHIFKEKTGVSPNEYRKRQKKTSI